MLLYPYQERRVQAGAPSPVLDLVEFERLHAAMKRRLLSSALERDPRQLKLDLHYGDVLESNTRMRI